MANNMIESVKHSKFRLPFFILPFAAYGLYLIGDISGGNLGIWICARLHLTGGAADKLLLLSVGITALLIILWVKLVEGRTVGDLGLVKHSLVKDSSIGAAAGLISFIVIVGIGLVLKTVVYQSSNFSPGAFAGVLLAIPFWIIQAGTEELLTRGWVLPEVSAKTNRLTGVVVSAILFVFLHISNDGLSAIAVINIFLIGVILSIYTLRSDSIWGAIMYHAFWNFTQGSLLGMSVSGGSGTKPSLLSFTTEGDRLLSGGTFGIEGSIITTAILLILLSALLIYIIKGPVSQK